MYYLYEHTHMPAYVPHLERQNFSISYDSGQGDPHIDLVGRCYGCHPLKIIYASISCITIKYHIIDMKFVFEKERKKMIYTIRWLFPSPLPDTKFELTGQV